MHSPPTSVSSAPPAVPLQPTAGQAEGAFTTSACPLAPYYLRSSTLAAVTLLTLIFAFYSTAMPLWHGDIWAHMKFGQWIVDKGLLPDREPFSPFSDQTQTLVHFAWLSQVFFYFVFQAGSALAGGDELRSLAGGVEMLRFSYGLLVMLKFGFLLAAYRQMARSLPLACLGVALVFMFSTSTSALLRPQVIGETLFACLAWLLCKPRLGWPTMVAMPLLVVLWANCDGSFLLGLALIGIFCLGRFLDQARTETGRDVRRALRDVHAWRLVSVLILAALAACLNPHGPSLFLEVVQLGKQPNMATMSEWQPLNYSDGTGEPWRQAILLALIGASQVLSARPLSIMSLLLLLTFGIAPFVQQRTMTWWVMLVPLLLLPLGHDVQARLFGEGFPNRSVPRLRNTVTAGAVVVLAAIWSPLSHLLVGSQPTSLTVSVSEATPIDLALRLNHPDLKRDPYAKAFAAALPDGRFRGRIFATASLSDYLVWSAPPDTPPLVYSHCQLFDEDQWYDYRTVLLGKPAWEEVLYRRGVNLVLIEIEESKDLAEKLRQSPNWAVILDEAGDRAKRDPRTRVLAALRKIPR